MGQEGRDLITNVHNLFSLQVEYSIHQNSKIAYYGHPNSYQERQYTRKL